MGKYLVQGSWWIEATNSKEAIGIIENAVAGNTTSDLEDSEVLESQDDDTTGFEESEDDGA